MGPTDGKKKKKKASSIEADVENVADEHDDGAVLVQAKTKKNKKRKDAAVAEADLGDLAAEQHDGELPVQAKSKKKKKRKEVDALEEVADVDVSLSTEAKKPKKNSEADVEGRQSATKEPRVINNALRVFVGGIPRTIDEATLRKDFEECGELTNVKLLLDGQTWESKGIAFLTFKDEAGMNAALAYDGDDYGGRKLSVKKAEAKGSGKGSGSTTGTKPPGCNSVVLKRLSPDVTEDDLKDLFRSTCPLRVGLLLDKSTGQSRCTARIDYKDGSGVDEAMKHSGSSLKGYVLCMDYCKPREW